MICKYIWSTRVHPNPPAPNLDTELGALLERRVVIERDPASRERLAEELSGGNQLSKLKRLKGSTREVRGLNESEQIELLGIPAGLLRAAEDVRVMSQGVMSMSRKLLGEGYSAPVLTRILAGLRGYIPEKAMLPECQNASRWLKDTCECNPPVK